MDRVELNIQFSKEVYASYHKKYQDYITPSFKSLIDDSLGILRNALIIGLIYGPTIAKGFGWSMYWIGLVSSLGYTIHKFWKKKITAEAEIEKMQTEVPKWLDERAKTENYKIVLDSLGISLIEDGTPTLFLPKEGIKVFVSNEQMVYLAESINSTKSSLLFLKDSMGEDSFKVLTHYVKTELKDAEEFNSLISI